MQKSPGQQQHAADDAAPFEAGQPPFFGETVKFRQPGHGQKNQDQNAHAVGNQGVGGEQGGENDRPENHRGDQPAEKDLRL
jgi:hypothetical protein